MITPNQALVSSYDYGLVGLSVVIAILAAYAALDLAARVTSAAGRTRLSWLSGGAIAMGTGIWSMHYIGMLAFHLPISVVYDWPTVLLSLLAAIFASAVALFVVSRKQMNLMDASIGSIFMGSGIAIMHYTGMAAMRLPAICHWSPSLVVLSVVLAVAISFVALLLTFHFRGDMSAWSWLKISSAVVMGAAIPIMHYTGMAAARFTPSSSAMAQWNRAYAVSTGTLSAAGVSIVIFMILALALLTSVVGRRFSVQASELMTSREELARLNAELEQRVIDRTAQLDSANKTLEAEIAMRRVTELAQRKSQQLIQTVFDNSPTIIYVKDLQGRYLLANRLFSEVFHISQEAILGKTAHDLFPPDIAARVHTMDVRVVASSAALAEEEIVPHNDGLHTYASVKCALRDETGKPYAVFGTSTDITERKRAQDQQLKLKDEFLSHISHELRTPLAAICQFTSILEDGLAGELNLDQRGNLQIISRNAWQLKSMIDDLVEVTRVQAGKLTIELQRASVSAAVAYGVSTLQESAAAKKITLAADVPRLLSAHADPIRLRQILVILLDNAIKFTPPQGVVTVRACVFENDPSHLLVEVSDSGCGISPDKTERIFERLYQAATTFQNSRNGLGLGLYICKELVTQHDGQIWATNNPLGGSVFSFTLPVLSVARLISPLLKDKEWPSSSVALVTVEIGVKDNWNSKEDLDQWSRETRKVIGRCLMPDLDVLLPKMSAGGSGELLFVVAFADEKGIVVLTNRIRKQLERLEQLTQAGMASSVSYRLLAPAPTGEGEPAGNSAEGLAARIEELINSETISRKYSSWAIMPEAITQDMPLTRPT